MPLVILNTIGNVRIKRASETPKTQKLLEQLIKANLGGSEQNPSIIGNSNSVSFGSDFKSKDTTLLHKAGTQFGRILEGGTDVIVAPSKWLTHMQENWLIYLVCTTILVVCGLLIYCLIRRKMSPHAIYSATAGNQNQNQNQNFSSMVMDEAIKIAKFHRALHDK